MVTRLYMFVICHFYLYLHLMHLSMCCVTDWRSALHWILLFHILSLKCTKGCSTRWTYLIFPLKVKLIMCDQFKKSSFLLIRNNISFTHTLSIFKFYMYYTCSISMSNFYKLIYPAFYYWSWAQWYVSYESNHAVYKTWPSCKYSFLL